MAAVINRTTLVYHKSVNTPDYPPADWIINPDMSAVEGVSKIYWKVVGDTVVEMDQSEKDAVDAAQAAAATAAARAAVPPDDPIAADGLVHAVHYCVEEYDTKKLLLRETQYGTDNGDCTYADPIQLTEYTYAQKKLTSKTVTRYWADGTVRDTETWRYFTDGLKVIKKKEVA